jgi:hypothetical protein
MGFYVEFSTGITLAKKVGYKANNKRRKRG